MYSKQRSKSAAAYRKYRDLRIENFVFVISVFSLPTKYYFFSNFLFSFSFPESEKRGGEVNGTPNRGLR